MEVTVKLLRKAMHAVAAQSQIRLFLIDGERASGPLHKSRTSSPSSHSSLLLLPGFPRKLDQLQLFEASICAASCAIFLDTRSEDRRTRLTGRAKTGKRQDDTAEIIQKRFKTFDETCMVVIDQLKSEERVITIDGNLSVEHVYVDIQKSLKESFAEALRLKRVDRLSESDNIRKEG